MSSEVVLLTGAGGYLGRQLADCLATRSFVLRALVREQSDKRGAAKARGDGGLFDQVLDWPTAKANPDTLHELLKGVSSVIHLASSQSSDPAQQADAHLHMPEALLAAGANTGLKRFIALSSVKAIAGEHDSAVLAVDQTPRPNSAYGEYKLAAEDLVRGHQANAALATYVLRLPMVYGANAGGNFALLQKIARSGVPLPVSKDNRRSVLCADNLFSFIECLLRAEETKGSATLHVADEQALSTYEFFKLIAAAQGAAGRTLPLSSRWADRLAGVPVVGGLATRLLGSLQMDSNLNEHFADWRMPLDTATGVQNAIDGRRLD